jgi:anaerobic glycerol-3-phosphate dehydrogenase
MALTCRVSRMAKGAALLEMKALCYPAGDPRPTPSVETVDGDSGDIQDLFRCYPAGRLPRTSSVETVCGDYDDVNDVNDVNPYRHTAAARIQKIWRDKKARAFHQQLHVHPSGHLTLRHALQQGIAFTRPSEYINKNHPVWSAELGQKKSNKVTISGISSVSEFPKDGMGGTPQSQPTNMVERTPKALKFNKVSFEPNLCAPVSGLQRCAPKTICGVKVTAAIDDKIAHLEALVKKMEEESHAPSEDDQVLYIAEESNHSGPVNGFFIKTL